MNEKWRGIKAIALLLMMVGFMAAIVGISAFNNEENNILIIAIGVFVFLFSLGIFLVLSKSNDKKILADTSQNSHSKSNDNHMSRKVPLIDINKTQNEQVMHVVKAINISKNAKCMITKIPLSNQKDILCCPNCKSNFLGSYLRNWVENHKKCPVCKTKLRITKLET